MLTSSPAPPAARNARTAALQAPVRELVAVRRAPAPRARLPRGWRRWWRRCRATRCHVAGLRPRPGSGRTPAAPNRPASGGPAPAPRACVSARRGAEDRRCRGPTPASGGLRRSFAPMAAIRRAPARQRCRRMAPQASAGPDRSQAPRRGSPGRASRAVSSAPGTEPDAHAHGRRQAPRRSRRRCHGR